MLFVGMHIRWRREEQALLGQGESWRRFVRGTVRRSERLGHTGCAVLRYMGQRQKRGLGFAQAAGVRAVVRGTVQRSEKLGQAGCSATIYGSAEEGLVCAQCALHMAAQAAD